MDDKEILGHIRDLVEEEHSLRSASKGGQEAQRLQQLEQMLDQCWDLLRQRRAKADAGQDPDAAAARPLDEVESYLQ